MSITFSEQVFTEIINATGSNTLIVSDFELSLSGNSSLTLSSFTPTSISVSGNSYELKIPFNGFANGTESLTITIPNNSVFDIAGNTFSSSQTIGLNNNLLIYYDFSNPNSYNGQTTTSSNASVTDLSGNNNDGFVRGMSFHKNYLFIGLSKLRKNSSTFGKLPFAEKAKEAGIVVVHLPTKSIVGKITYLTSLDEIYDIHILADKTRPNILNTLTDDHKKGLMIPNTTFWRQENNDE